eukprot:365689-Chlamydomonas_euryale.AAC.6
MPPPHARPMQRPMPAPCSVPCPPHAAAPCPEERSPRTGAAAAAAASCIVRCALSVKSAPLSESDTTRRLPLMGSQPSSDQPAELAATVQASGRRAARRGEAARTCVAKRGGGGGQGWQSGRRAAERGQRRGEAKPGGRARRRSQAARPSSKQGQAAKPGGKAKQQGQAAKPGGEAKQQGQAAKPGGEAKQQGQSAKPGGKAKQQGQAARPGGKARRQGRAARPGGKASDLYAWKGAASQGCRNFGTWHYVLLIRLWVQARGFRFERVVHHTPSAPALRLFAFLPLRVSFTGPFGCNNFSNTYIHTQTHTTHSPAHTLSLLTPEGALASAAGRQLRRASRREAAACATPQARWPPATASARRLSPSKAPVQCS